VAAALAVLDVIEADGLCARAEEIGRTTRARLDALATTPEGACIGQVRGLGAMIAFELVADRATRAPDPVLCAAIVAEAEARGLIILACGVHGNVVRLLPPLTIEHEILNEALGIIEAAVAAATRHSQAA
jgi:4-aminobutyrate aminotransferase/(S)-3-amino-2-methylpropionate transaminase